MGDNPKNEQPMEWNRGDPNRRCVAHNKSGEQCRKWAIRGGVVCTHHGGSAPQVMARARENLALAADHNRSNIQRLADSAESEQVRLQANNSLLDRAGLSPKHAVELELKPHEQLYNDVFDPTAGPHQSRYNDVAPAPAALAGPHDAEPLEVVDAEVVDAPAPHPGYPRTGRTPGDRRDGPPNRPAFATGDVGRPPGKGLMTAEDAVAGQRAYISSQRIKKAR